MRKIYLTLAIMAMTAVPTVALAQDSGEEWTPAIETGYFRIVHNGYGDVLNVDQKYGFSLNATRTEDEGSKGNHACSSHSPININMYILFT